jgi:hypothetical protein
VFLIPLLLLSCAAPTVVPEPRSPTPTTGASASPSAVTITGTVNWNHHPQSGVRVEISELGAPWGCLGSAAKLTTTTAADGAFTAAVVGLSATTPVGAFVCAYGPFLDGGRPADMSASPRTVGSVDLAREITNLSIRDGDRVSAGPLTITWDPVPEATSYCVAVWRISTGYQSGPYCLPGTMGERIASNRFATPALKPDLYTVSVVALTDVIVGSRPNKPLSFTVTAP